ncbi:MAG: response regulator [Pseudomonadota bacterium]
MSIIKNNDEAIKYKAHILLVDDGKVNRILGKKILNKLSYQVSLAEDGLQAIAQIKNNNTSTFDLILMDLEMPKLGGLQAATEIREKKLCYAPIYALTSHDSEETRLLCRAAKMNGYIQKPIKIDTIKIVLDKLFS